MNITVLGAGLMGRLLASQLAQQGHRVSLFDAHEPQGTQSAAYAAAAMLAPLAESAVAEASVVQMGMYALDRWPALIAELNAPVYFQRNGTLVLWHRQDAAEAQRFCGQMEATHRAIPLSPVAQRIDADGIAQLEPSIGHRFAHGVYLPGEGQLDNHQLMPALLERLAQLQVQLYWNSPRAPEDFMPGEHGQPDWVFDCRGLGAQPQWSAVRGVRGEIVTLHAPEVHLSRPTRLLHPRYPIYIAPKENGIYRIGATEIESDDRSPVSVRSVLELLSAAYTVHTGFAEARILDVVAQCRPTLPNNLPAIRWLGARTLQINGLYRHGFLIAPAILDMVLEVFKQGQSTLAQQFSVPIETAGR